MRRPRPRTPSNVELGLPRLRCDCCGVLSDRVVCPLCRVGLSTYAALHAPDRRHNGRAFVNWRRPR